MTHQLSFADSEYQNKRRQTQKKNLSKPALLLASLIVISTLTTTANASGSYGSASGNNQQRSYNLGKHVFHKKIACKSCPLPSVNIDKNEAELMIEQLKSRKDLMKLLRPKERDAAIYYLKKRYRIY